MAYLDPQEPNEIAETNTDRASNIIFIDASLGNDPSLIPDTSNSEVILLNSQFDGIEQIGKTLENYRDLDSVQIFSHGDAGFLQLGDSFLTNSNLDRYQNELQAWGEALDSEGDLLFYGCNVGANSEGLNFVSQIASITGADVAASNDLTGNIELGGDWVLEVAVGAIETQTFTLTEYGGLLALSQQDILNGNTADFNGDGKADLLRQEKGHWDDDGHNTADIFLSTGNGFNQINLPENLNIKGDETILHLGDFNGDGKSDILRQEKAVADDDNFNTASLLISTGNGFNEISLPESLYLQGDFTNLHVGDFNGDGKSDFLRQHKLAWDNTNSALTGTLFISYGSGFIPYTTSANFNLQGDYTNLHVGDFNGDGRADLLRQEKNSFDTNKDNDAHLLISQGTGFQASFQQIALPGDLELNGDYTNLYVGDFNGDGKDDIIRQEKGLLDKDRRNTANLLISTGNGFNKINLTESFNLKGDYTNLHVGDFNGDGKDDFIRQEKNFWDGDSTNTAKIFISTGSNFNPIDLSEDFNLGGDYTNLYTGDYNGDGKTDLIRQEKGWYGYDSNSGSNSHLLLSTGNNFNQSSISNSGVSFDGNFNNIITNNTNTNYLANNTTNGLKFNFTYDDGVTFNQKKAFEFAGQMWSELLRDNVTVNLHISMANSSDLPANTIGGAVPFFHQNTSYSRFRRSLSNDIDNKALNYGNNDDTTALSSLNRGNSFEALAPSEDNNGTLRSFDKVAVTRANAKAIGLIDSDHTALDGTIVMNNLIGTGVSWQYDYFSDIGNNKLDFTTVAMHEIGHTLGFVSVVDGLSNENYQDQSVLNESITALDLFRYLEGSNSRSIRTTNSVLSIDGGGTSLARTAYGKENIGGDNDADGYQASHFKDEDNVGIMDPVLETNTRKQIGELDLRALDVIGWDRKYAANSWGNLASQAWNSADDTGNINRNTDVDSMLRDWRWARRGSGGRLYQSGNIAQFLAQEGFFNVGAFRNSFDFSSVDSTVDNITIEHQLHTVVDRFGIEVLDVLEAQIDESYDSLDSEVKQSNNSAVINNEDLVSGIDEWLSEYELDKMSLSKLKDLLEQPELVESLVTNLD